MSISEHTGEAIIENGAIVIRIPIADLSTVVEGAWAAGGVDTRFIITDLDEYSKELIRELNREEEDGTTLIHRMFDKAFLETLEQGAFGIEEHPNQEDGSGEDDE